MSVHGQRGKVKSASRIRSQRISGTAMSYSKGAPAFSGSGSSEDGLGIFSSTELTYWLGRHAIGNIGEVTTIDSKKILGLIRAISPAGDMGLTYAYTPQKTKNGYVHANDITVPLSDWKMIRISNIKLSDGLMGEFKTDSDANLESESIEQVATDKELVPFFGSSDAVQDCVLDHGGFPAEEMFKTNKELFSVSSTYNPELTEYTTAVDRNAPNFSETEARCAQLARDIEEGPTAPTLEDACDDEEMAFSAVVRAPRDLPAQPRQSARKARGSQECPITSHSGYAKVRVQSGHTVIASTAEASESPGAISEPANGELKSEKELMPSASKPAEMTEIEETPASTLTSAENALVSTVEEKVKKSTLDPNAPEFQPMSLQYASLVSHSQLHQTVGNASFAAPIALQSVSATQAGQLQMPSVQTYVAAAPPHLYVPTSVPYGPHSGPVPHLFSNASVANNVQLHGRGGSLPPTIQHQHFPNSINPQAAVLLQQPQQPGMSLPQLLTSQPPILAGPSPVNRFSGAPSSIAHTHQRSESTTAPHSSAYGIPHSNMSVSTFQSPLYQVPHSGGAFPMWVTGHPQLGLHLIPGAGGSSPLVVGNLPLSQPTGQQLYPTHAMLHMQPTQLSVQVQVPPAPPSTTPQQSQSQQVFQAPSVSFQDQPHHIQLPAYAANMLSSQAGAVPNYYSTPVLTGANPTNQALPAGLLHLVNQGSVQHAVSGNVGHPPPAMDPNLVNASIPTHFTQSNELLQQFAAAHFLQSQFAAGQHVNSQPFQHRAYQTLAAMVANSNNPSSQSH